MVERGLLNDNANINNRKINGKRGFRDKNRGY